MSYELSFLSHFYTATGFVQREYKMRNIETRRKCELEQAPDVRECVFFVADECNGVAKTGPAQVIIAIPLITMKILSTLKIS